MKKCPRCKQHTIAFDVYECTSDECSCIAVSEETYSYLRNNPNTNKIDIVEVKNGFGRNYLLPHDLAEIATKGALKNRELNLSRIKQKAEKLHQEALSQAEIIKGIEKLQIEAKAGESGKLFGAITTRKLADLLKEKTGIEVDRRNISLNNPINALGEYKMFLKITSKVSVDLPVEVVASEIIKETRIIEEIEIIEEVEGDSEEITEKNSEEEADWRQRQEEGQSPSEMPFNADNQEAEETSEE